MKNHTAKLAGKTALVTGAARRIGAAIVQRLHAEGMNLVLHYRSSAAEARALCQQLNAARADSAILAQADLLDTAALAALVKTAMHWGSLDLLVNNASLFHATPLGQVSQAGWLELMDANLKAPFFLSQAAAPQLKNSGGAIINLLDIHARRPLPGYSVYSISKAGLAMLTRALAQELAPQVRVNGVAPGPILWPQQGLDESARQAILESTALKRAGSPEDVAAAIVYLVRDADYVTGQVLAVDGGRSIGW